MGAKSASELRAELGEAAIYSPTDAARRMPMRLADALDLLRREGLIRRRAGVQVVIWGDVLEFFRAEETGANSTPAQTPIKARVDLSRKPSK